VRIALVADTHIPTTIPELPFPLLEHLKGVDLILHAGDLVCMEVLEALRKVAKTIAVRGNADEPDVVRQLPYKQSLTLAGTSIGLIHGNQPPEIEREYLKPEYDYDSPPVRGFYEFLLNEFPEADIIVFGHLNVPLVKRENNRLLINPGSVAPYRGRCSFGILHLDPSGAEAEIIEL
jgi:putative phosphoesterase